MHYPQVLCQELQYIGVKGHAEILKIAVKVLEKIQESQRSLHLERK